MNEGTEDLWNEEDFTSLNELDLMAIEVHNIEGMGLHRMELTPQLAEEMGYRVLFDLAFRDSPVAERYTTRNASLALSAYIRTLLPNKAPFQEWLAGDYNALSDQEKRGAILMFGKARCYTCHYSPALNSMEFHAIGVNDLYQRGGLNTWEYDRRNFGRGGFTKDPNDMFEFKVPQLYNVGDGAFYFHGSSKETLEEVVDYFNQAIPENPNVPASQISSKFKPLNLTPEEITDLLQFLKNGLRDPFLDRYVPTYVQSGNCFPNNDPLSAEQMGCE